MLYGNLVFVLRLCFPGCLLSNGWYNMLFGALVVDLLLARWLMRLPCGVRVWIVGWRFAWVADLFWCFMVWCRAGLFCWVALYIGGFVDLCRLCWIDWCLRFWVDLTLFLVSKFGGWCDILFGAFRVLVSVSLVGV